MSGSIVVLEISDDSRGALWSRLPGTEGLLVVDESASKSFDVKAW